ncbi:hypothetical protein C8T65DRAFT_647961, partial [Cerioporus squamosus]
MRLLILLVSRLVTLLFRTTAQGLMVPTRRSFTVPTAVRICAGQENHLRHLCLRLYSGPTRSGWVQLLYTVLFRHKTYHQEQSAASSSADGSLQGSN